MSYPRLIIDLEKIRQNAAVIIELGAKYGIQIQAVTKVTCAQIDVARTLLEAGACGLADSRIQNIAKLKEAGLETEYTLLRIPMLSEVEAVVNFADVSLNSEPETIKALSLEARRQGKEHKVIIMVDLGDLREGLWPDRLLPVLNEVSDLPGIRIYGLGTNLTCYGGVLPTEDNLGRLVELVREVESELGYQLEVVSGGNSSSLPLLLAGGIPRGINQLRVGETILIGNNVNERKPFPGTYQDTFILEAEIIELQEKPSVPIGKRGYDAFGKPTRFKDRGDIWRAILGIGKQDIAFNGLTPLDKGIDILGGSSDHLILDVTKSERKYRVGDIVRFTVNYESLLKASTSPYVQKVVVS